MQKIIRLMIALVAIVASAIYAEGATKWDSATARLAAQITAITGPGNASLTFKNLSSLSPSEVAAIRVPLETQLRAAGVQLRDSANSASEIQVTLSENVRDWLLVAEVRQGPETKIAMVGVGKGTAGALAQAGSAMVLRKSFLMSQSEPILDAAAVDSGSARNLLVLSRASIDLYSWGAGTWTRQQSFTITHNGPLPRDLRGRIIVAQDHLFDAYLPGVSCSSSAGTPISVTCRDTDDPWPIGGQKALFNSARNYFTGILVPGFGVQVPSFFSAATLPRPNYTLWLFNGVDGQVRAFDGMELRAIPGTRDWGSDMTSIRSTCGLGTQLLVSTAGDDNSPDALHAYEIVDREPAEISSPMTADGPVTALWPTGDASSATAVVRNAQTGQYDAYNVSITCNQ